VESIVVTQDVQVIMSATGVTLDTRVISVIHVILIMATTGIWIIVIVYVAMKSVIVPPDV